MTKKFFLSTLVISLMIGYGYGLLSYKFDLFPVPVIRYVKEYSLDDGIDTVGYRNADDRTPIDCKNLTDGAAIILTVGQSNAANHGEARYTPRRSVFNYNFFDNKCYLAADPLLGATGLGGSVWSRLGDLLIAQGTFEQVLFAPIAVNASSIQRWRPGGDLHSRIQRAVQGLRSYGLEPTHVLWHQGEADAMQRMEGVVYGRYLQEVIESFRSRGVGAPIYIAVASMCHNSGSEQITRAQIEAAERNPMVFAGANSDRIDSLSLRYDGCHFSEQGLRQHAGLWLRALLSESHTESTKLSVGEPVT